MHYYDIWASSDFSISTTVVNYIFDDKVLKTQFCNIVHDTMLTLVLSRGGEAFPTVYNPKLGVMGERC